MRPARCYPAARRDTMRRMIQHRHHWLPVTAKHVLVLCGAVLFAGGGVAGETSLFPEFKNETAREYLLAVGRGFSTQAVSGADSCLIQAQLASDLGQADQAERLARQGFQLDTNRADLQFFLARLFIRQDRWEEAARCLRTALQLDPKLDDAYRRLGMVLDRLGQRDEARQAYESGVRLSPDNVTLRLLLGRLLLDENRPADAVPHLERACQLNPNEANAFYVLSQAQRRLGQTEAARQTLEKFQKVRKNEYDAEVEDRMTADDQKTMQAIAAGFHASAAAFFFNQDQVGRAEAHLRQAIRISPEALPPRELLANVYVRTDRLPEARAAYEELIRLAPRRADYRVNLATLYLHLRETPPALVELHKALELDPNQPEALANLARCYLSSRQNSPEALSLCRRLIALQPTAPNYDLLGWACYANGQIQDALDALTNAIHLEPDNPAYRQRYRRISLGP